MTILGFTMGSSCVRQVGLTFLTLLTGHLSGVCGQVPQEEENKLVGMVAGGVIGGAIIILMLVILYYICRPPPRHAKQNQTHLSDLTVGSEAVPQPEKYPHVPPGVWTSNPSLGLTPPAAGQKGLTRYPYPEPAMEETTRGKKSHYFYQRTLRRAKSAIQRLPVVLRARRAASFTGNDYLRYSPFSDVTSGSTADVHYASSLPGVMFYYGLPGPIARSKVISSNGTAQVITESIAIDDDAGKATVTARAFSNFARPLEEYPKEDSAPGYTSIQAPSHKQIDSHLTMTARALSPPFSVMLAQNGQQLLYRPAIRRTNSRNVHDYVPAILGGSGVPEGPLEKGISPAARVTLEVGEGIWGQSPGVGTQPYGRGVLLRRSPSEAAAYASIPYTGSEGGRQTEFNFTYQGVRRSHSDVSGLGAAPNPSDIYAVPSKLRRSRDAAEEGLQPLDGPYDLEGSESPLPPPLPPPITATQPKDKVIQTMRGVIQTMRGTAALNMGPEMEETQMALENTQRALEGTSPVDKKGTSGKGFTVVLAHGEEERTVATPTGGGQGQNGLTQGFQTDGPDLTRHLPQFDHTDVEAADSAFQFLDQYSLSRECPSARSSLSYNAGMVYMLSAEAPESGRKFEPEPPVITEHAYEKHVADEAFRFLDDFEDGEDAPR